MESLLPSLDGDGSRQAWREFRICHDEFCTWEAEQHEKGARDTSPPQERPLTGNEAWLNATDGDENE